MTIFGSSRGVFRDMTIDTSGGKGVQVSIPGGNAIDAMSLVTAFNVEQNENCAVTQCLNGGVFLYTFGHDPGRSAFTLGVTSFLNSCSGNVGESLQNAISVYNKGRVSTSKAKSVLTIGSGALTGYLIGQDIAVNDNELGIFTTNYTFMALNVQK